MESGIKDEFWCVQVLLTAVHLAKSRNVFSTEEEDVVNEASFLICNKLQIDLEALLNYTDDEKVHN